MIQTQSNGNIIFKVFRECDVIMGSSEWFFVIEFDEITSIREEINDKDEAMKIENEARNVKKMKNKNNGE